MEFYFTNFCIIVLYLFLYNRVIFNQVLNLCVYRIVLLIPAAFEFIIGKRSRNSISSRFQLVFWVRARDCTTFMLHDLADFYVESVTAHRIKINDHSCFYNRWPKSKTKLKLKHLWEQGVAFWGSGCFGGLTQLAYSAYREDQLWIWR